MIDPSVLPATLQRFVVTTTGCWEWQGARTRGGYGIAVLSGHRTTAHRHVYKIVHGDPGALVVDHLCRNRGCINPDHLEAVTQKENIMRGDGPSLTKARPRRTHCPAGHPYDERNTRINRHGYALCRLCGRDYMRRRRANVGSA